MIYYKIISSKKHGCIPLDYVDCTSKLLAKNGLAHVESPIKLSITYTVIEHDIS